MIFPSLFFFSPGPQRWFYRIWHALLCFLRCIQPCSGWSICIGRSLLCSGKWSSSLWAFIIYMTWPIFCRTAGGRRALAPLLSLSAACFKNTKVWNVCDCERHWGSRHSRAVAHCFHVICRNLTTHLELQTFALRQINIKSNTQTKGVQSFSCCFQSVDIFSQDSWETFYLFIFSTEFNQCGKPKGIFYSYQTLPLKVLTLTTAQKFPHTLWVWRLFFHSHDCFSWKASKLLMNTHGIM